MPRQSNIKRYRGINSSVSTHSFRRASRHTAVLHAHKQQERLEQIKEQRNAELEALREEELLNADRMFADLDIETSCYPRDAEMHDNYASNHSDDDDEGDGDGLSDLTHQIHKVIGFRYQDTRDRRDRLQLQMDHWATQMPELIEAYLDYCSRDIGDGMPTIEEPNMTPDASGSIVGVELVDLFTRRTATLVSRAGQTYPNENLIYHGYLGCSPIVPNVAISLRTLSAFRQAHRVCPRFTVQAQCKMLCHIHYVPYRPYLATQFSLAYDIYLEILHRVELRVREALGHNTKDWRLLNSCPACFYHLEDEPSLEFDWLVSIDGNNSLKRWDKSVYGTAPVEDSRVGRSDFWITPIDVDKFQYEVKATTTQAADAAVDHEWETEETLVDTQFNCVDRWRNAGPETRKKVLSAFHETGIFISSCRHRFVLLVCDMIKSGELYVFILTPHFNTKMVTLRAKYALAMIDRLLSVYGQNGGCAYDIGCAAAVTLANSSLGPRARALNFRLMVGAFHGHAHNRKCQLDWHPLYIRGTGHTEGEGCEHVFSASNELARGTRHAGRFHRLQAIEEHFSFWNQDKYEALTRFLRNHYRDALQAVRTLTAELSVLRTTLHLTDDDFTNFLSEERQYLVSLKQPPLQDQLRIRYVEVLDELEEKRSEWVRAHEAANQALTSVPTGDMAALSQAIIQARVRVDTAYTMLQTTQKLAGQLQAQLGLEKAWTVDSEEYNRSKAEVSMRKYHRALDELERLVVMRLFELSKLSMSGTGYKLRQQISKALQRRSEAIRKAIMRYNTQAAALDPPRGTISWKQITSYTILGEFDLLRQSRGQVQEQRWSQPAYREATVKYFKLCRAKEEITRLNIEIRRLRTAIHDEDVHTTQVIADLLQSDRLLGLELQRLYRPRAAVNAVHLQRLSALAELDGYSGDQSIGVRLQHVPEDITRDKVAGALSGVEIPTLEERGQLSEIEAVRIGQLYVSGELGDSDLIEEEEEAILAQQMADFINDID